MFCCMHGEDMLTSMSGSGQPGLSRCPDQGVQLTGACGGVGAYARGVAMNAGALGNQVNSTRPMIAVLYKLLRRSTGLAN
jgi:hypothetical protein